MITERTLRQWRKEALTKDEKLSNTSYKESVVIDLYRERIIRLTQELLDQHLMRK